MAGYDDQAVPTNNARGQLALLEEEARHRAQARVEDRIRTGKDVGLGRMPSRYEHVNAVWLELSLIAADLLVFTQSRLPTFELELRRAEPKTPRYRLLQAAARIARGQ